MVDHMRGASADTDVAVRGFASLNNSVTVQKILPDFALNPGRVDVERDVVIAAGDGDVQYNRAKGGYDVVGEQISFESARMVRYRPGGLNYAGIATVIPTDPPAGQLDIGLGNVPYHDFDQTGAFGQSDSEILLRLTSNGDWAFVIRRDDVETILPRKPDAESWEGTPAEGRTWSPDAVASDGEYVEDQAGERAGRMFAFDAADGSGTGSGNRSGIDLDQRPIIILPKLVGTWYGKGPYFLTFETVGSGGFQRMFPMVGFESEVQSIGTRATHPLMARYDDGGAGEPYAFEVYGRQGSGAGEIGAQPKTPWELTDGFSYGQGLGNAELVMAYRRAPESAAAEPVNYRGSVYGLLNLHAYTNQRSVAFLAFDIDFGSQTPDWGEPTSVQEQAESSIQVATQDTTGSNLTADPMTGTIQSGTMVEATGQGGGGDIASLDPVEQPNSRTKPLGVYMFSLNNNASGAELLTVFSEEGT